MASKKNLTKKADNYSNSTSNTIIYALAGNDSVGNSASKVTIFGGAGADSIRNYGGNKVKFFGEAGKDFIYNHGADTVTIDGGAGNDKIHTYKTDHVTITGGKGNDSIQLGGYDYIGAGTAKNTVIKYASGDGNDTIFGFDSNDTLHITSGTYKTSVKGNDFIVTVGKQKIILKNAVGSDLEKVTIKNSKGKIGIYNDWKTKTIENATVSANNVTIKAPKSGSYITNYGDKVNFIGNAGSDEIVNFGNKVTISGGKGKDTVYSGGNYVSISGGAGDDQIGSAAIGNYSTVNGGKGDDYISMIDYYDGSMVTTHDSYKTVVQYANGDGKDTVFGFNADDTLEITSGSYVKVVSENDVVFKVGNGSVTLKNVNDKKLKVKGTEFLQKGLSYNKARTVLTANKKFKDTSIDFANYPTVKNLNISTLTKGIKIIGNSLANSIIGGKGNDTLYGNNGNDYLNGGNGNDYLDGGKNNDKIFGGKGNDTLLGGAGNDTLTGGAGKDVFVYSAGKDVITDYTAGQDKIKISGTIKKTSYKNKDVIFTIGSGTLTVKNGKGKKISIENAKGKTSTKTYSTSAVSQLWFAEENNFVTTDNLSSITENNLTPTALEKISENNFKNLTTENNFVTFSEK